MKKQQGCITGKVWTQEDCLKLFKTVVAKGKKWQEIAKDFDLSADSIRKKYSKTNWNNFFNKLKLKESAIVAEVLKETEQDDTSQKLINQAKEKIIKASNDRVNKELVQRAAITDLILEKLESAVYKVPKIDTAKITYPKTVFQHRPQEACLVLSDLHIGLACIPEEVGGLGEYNLDVFKMRLKNLINSITKITEYHRKSYRIDTLNVFALGDNVHGSNDAGKWGFLHTEQNIIDQIFCAISELSEALLKLKKVFPKIKFYGTQGNHGRIGGRPGIEKHFVNWDYLVYKYIEIALKNQSDIQFQIPRAPFQVAQILNDKFFLIHGETVKSWNSLPFYGMVRAENRYQTMIAQNKNIEELWEDIEKDKIDKNDARKLLEYALSYAKPFSHFILGHHHQIADIPVGFNNIMMNGAFPGGDDYTINQLMTCGKPSQKFFGVHEEGISWTYNIELDRE